jgi:hypothetical protein
MALFELIYNSLYQGWFIPSVIEIGQLVLKEKFFSVFLLLRYCLPLGKGVPFHLNNLESPLPKDDLCEVWLK